MALVAGVLHDMELDPGVLSSMAIYPKTIRIMHSLSKNILEGWDIYHFKDHILLGMLKV